MNNEKMVTNWQNAIIAECENRLKRKLTESENIFVTSRGGFLALEAIQDTINSIDGKELEQYLNSENNGQTE